MVSNSKVHFTKLKQIYFSRQTLLHVLVPVRHRIQYDWRGLHHLTRPRTAISEDPTRHTEPDRNEFQHAWIA